MQPAESEGAFRSWLQQIASEVAGGGHIAEDTPFMDLGMDSLSSIKARQEVPRQNGNCLRQEPSQYSPSGMAISGNPAALKLEL